MAEFWFKPKRFGYGAGLPTAWQGWAVLVAYIAAVCLAAALPVLFEDRPLGVLIALTVVVLLTVPLLLVCERRTEGGWRWRWGDE